MSLVAYDKSMMLFSKNNGPNVLGHEMVNDHKSRTCLGIIIIIIIILIIIILIIIIKIIIKTLFISQVYLAEHRGSTNWGDRKSNQHKSNQLKCWFLVRGENRGTHVHNIGFPL